MGLVLKRLNRLRDGNAGNNLVGAERLELPTFCV